MSETVPSAEGSSKKSHHDEVPPRLGAIPAMSGERDENVSAAIHGERRGRARWLQRRAIRKLNSCALSQPPVPVLFSRARM